MICVKDGKYAYCVIHDKSGGLMKIYDRETKKVVYTDPHIYDTFGTKQIYEMIERGGAENVIVRVKNAGRREG